MRLKRAKALDQVEGQEFEGRRRKEKRRRRREAKREREPRRRPFDEDDRDSLFDLLEDLLEDEGMEGVRRRVIGEAGWSAPTRIGARLRVQAATGYRAAVIELRPGLFLVAEMPERAVRADFGFVPFLAPLMLRAARRAIDPSQEPRGGVASLFRRREEALAPRQLTGPVAEVGWTDAEEVEEVIGCDCDRRRA